MNFRYSHLRLLIPLLIQYFFSRQHTLKVGIKTVEAKILDQQLKMVLLEHQYDTPISEVYQTLLNNAAFFAKIVKGF